MTQMIARLRRLRLPIGLALGLLALGGAVLPSLAAAPRQVEPTPIFGEPTVVTAETAGPPADAPPAPAAPSPAERATPTTTAATGGPDGCEPNQTPAQACVLAVDQVSGPYTLHPPGDRDHYRLSLSAGLQTTITMRPSQGLELIATIRDAVGGPPIATIAGPSLSATLPATVTGELTITVESPQPLLPEPHGYTITVRRQLPPQPGPAAATAALPDALENNWSPATAAPIALHSVYDLTLVCPEPRPDACPGGDHDYLRVPVKRGLRYLLATFDLAADVDTVIELFWADAAGQHQPIGGNDDYRPGQALLSALTWAAPADGDLLIRIGPRAGAQTAQLPPPPRGQPAPRSYRFAIVLAGSALAGELQARLDQQTFTTPTATPGRPAPAEATPRPAPSDAVPTRTPTPPPQATATISGTALIDDGSAAANAPLRTKTREGPATIWVAQSALRARPDPESEAIELLRQDTLVTLTGAAAGAWVEVETADGVLPGWMRAHDLRRVPEAQATAQANPASSGAAPGATAGGGAPPRAPTPSSGAAFTTLDPPDPPAPPAPAPRVALRAPIIVLQAEPGQPPEPGRPIAGRPLAGQRVQLISAFGDVLADGRTDGSGQVVLTATMLPGSAVRVRLPAAGIVRTLDPQRPETTIVLPAAPTGGAQ